MPFFETKKPPMSVTFAHDLSVGLVPFDKVGKDKTFWYGGKRYQLRVKSGRTWAYKV